MKNEAAIKACLCEVIELTLNKYVNEGGNLRDLDWFMVTNNMSNGYSD